MHLPPSTGRYTRRTSSIAFLCAHSRCLVAQAGKDPAEQGSWAVVCVLGWDHPPGGLGLCPGPAEGPAIAAARQRPGNLHPVGGAGWHAVPASTPADPGGLRGEHRAGPEPVPVCQGAVHEPSSRLHPSAVARAAGQVPEDRLCRSGALGTTGVDRLTHTRARRRTRARLISHDLRYIFPRRGCNRYVKLCKEAMKLHR